MESMPSNIKIKLHDVWYHYGNVAVQADQRKPVLYLYEAFGVFFLIIKYDIAELLKSTISIMVTRNVKIYMTAITMFML